MAKPESELKKAIKNGDVDDVKKIIGDVVPVNAELPGKVTALEFALTKEQREVVDELLRAGAKPRSQKNNNLLLDVPKFRDLKLLQRLVELGADVHAGDRKNLTPLLAAASAGFFDGVKYLLDKGADPLVRTKNGQSMLQLARGTRSFCDQILPSCDDDEAADLFRAQLTDIARIEALLESILSAEQVAALGGKLPPPAEPSTFWDLNDHVEFRIEVSPFPFTSGAESLLKGWLGRRANQDWLEHFTSEGRILTGCFSPAMRGLRLR